MICYDKLQKFDHMVIVMNQSGVDFAWIGARDEDGIDEYIFVQSRAEVPHWMWAKDQPKHVGGDCVWLNSGSGSLFVDHCNNSYAFICEVFP